LPGKTARHCLRGQGWRWDDVSFTMLHPDAQGGLTGNNASCVLRIETPGGQHLLLPGDIERATEGRLVAEQRDLLPAQVLVAPHHGSATSSSPDFVSAVGPDVVIVPAAWLNRYRFPKRDVIARYQAAGATILETGRSGAIRIKLPSQGKRLEISAWRDEYRHVWSWRE
jgi:competence protein ComEC